jgi:hypothetical protein
MRVVPKPDKSVPVLEADGKTMSQAWDEFFGYLQALNLPAFSKTAPTNGQVPIYNSTTQLYTPGAN